MFSSRTDWDVHLSPLFSLLQQKRSDGEEVIDLTESNPTRCGFTFLSELSLDSDFFRRSALYEPNPKGLPEARRTIADWYATQGAIVDPDQIVLTASTSEAYSFLFRLLCNSGESVATPKPGYPLFEYLSRLNDVGTHAYRLAYDGEWHIPVETFSDSFLGNLKAIVLVHPNNPTGSFIKVHERNRIIGQASLRGVSLIVDEVFHSYPFAIDAHRAGTFAATDEVLTFTVNGLSKLAGLPQMKLAWIVVSGPPDAARTALEKLEVIADTYLSVGTPAQQVLTTILQEQPALNARIGQRIGANYHALTRAFPDGSPITLLHCEGGWNATLRLPATKSDEEWAQDFLQNQHVLTHPGHLFEFETKSCIVVSLLPQETRFAEGIGRVITTVGK